MAHLILLLFCVIVVKVLWRVLYTVKQSFVKG